jgi:hypothetical protein
MILVQTLIATIIAYAINLVLQVALHVSAVALASMLQSVSGTMVFVVHMAIVAVSACLGVVLALRLFRQALPTAVAVGVMALAIIAIVGVLVVQEGRVGIELGVWIVDLMPLAFGLFFGRAIARDRLRTQMLAQAAE